MSCFKQLSDVLLLFKKCYDKLHITYIYSNIEYIELSINMFHKNMSTNASNIDYNQKYFLSSKSSY